MSQEVLEDDIPVVDLKYPVDKVIGGKMRAAFPFFLRKGGSKTQVPDSTIGTIMRCADINPSEAQVAEIFAAAKAKEKNATQKGYFEYDNLEQEVAAMMFNFPGCFTRLPKEKVLEVMNTAFGGRKLMEAPEFKEFFLTKGDKFTQDEASKALRFAQDMDTKLIHMEEWAEKLAKDGIPIPPDPLEPCSEEFR